MTGKVVAGMLALVFVVGLVGVTRAEGGAALDHPSIREVLAMARAGVHDAVIRERIAQIEIPELSGQDLAALKKEGLSDDVLITLVRRASRHPTPETPAPAPAPREIPPPASATPPPAESGEPFPEGMGRLVVEFRAPFPVTSLEVVVDGKRVASRGEVIEGQSEPAQFLERPARLSLKKGEVVYDELIPAGRHEILAGFAVTAVESDPEDEWSEYSRERYVSRGVRAERRTTPLSAWGVNPGVSCEIAQGETCRVVVELQRRRSRRTGGGTAYGLRYQLR
ncbi:MAG TPA: hypothetical protein ENK10_07105 [Acidobacteria bacterium]|nr:hypothetical protein [Acidobacteriota bacterium]